MALWACVLLAGCGGGTRLLQRTASTATVELRTPNAGQKLGFPTVATKNTTRVAGADAAADAAGVALAVYPSAAPGTHPGAVTIAPLNDWQAAIASAVLMARPIRAPVLLSGPSLPRATADALGVLQPTGSGSAAGAQVIRVGDVPRPGGLRSASIGGSGPFIDGVLRALDLRGGMRVPFRTARHQLPRRNRPLRERRPGKGQRQCRRRLG